MAKSDYKNKSVPELIELQKSLSEDRAKADADYRKQLLDVQGAIDKAVAGGEPSAEVVPDTTEE